MFILAHLLRHVSSARNWTLRLITMHVSAVSIRVERKLLRLARQLRHFAWFVKCTAAARLLDLGDWEDARCMHVYARTHCFANNGYWISIPTHSIIRPVYGKLLLFAFQAIPFPINWVKWYNGRSDCDRCERYEPIKRTSGNLWENRFVLHLGHM